MRGLSIRRAIRAQMLSIGEPWLGRIWLGLALAGIATYIPEQIPNGIALVVFAIWFAWMIAFHTSSLDECPNCSARVDVYTERYCSECGASLDEVPVSPEIDDPESVETAPAAGGSA